MKNDPLAGVLRGLALIRTGKRDAGIELIATHAGAARLTPDQARVLTSLLLTLEQYESLAKLLDPVLADGSIPAKLSSYFAAARALCHDAAGDRARAEELMRLTVTSYPAREVIKLAAQLAKRQERFEDATGHLKSLMMVFSQNVAVRPQLAETRAELADIALKTGDLVTAAHEIEQALAIRPTDRRYLALQEQILSARQAA